VARAVGVSVSTVSRALADAPGISSKVRREVKDAATALGYTARPAAAVHQLAIAYVTLGRATDGSSAFYQGIIAGLQRAAEEVGLALALQLIDDRALDAARLEGDLLRTGASCLLLVGIDPMPSTREWLRREGLPLVLVNGCDPELQFSGVAPTNFLGAVAATRRLLQAGHRRIVHLTPTNRWTIQQRTRGFQTAIREAEGARGTVRELLDGSSPEGEAAVRALLEEGPLDFTALFCMNDLVAVGALQALERAGIRVPEQISIVGFDDLPCAAMTSPRLSTMRVDREGIGVAAVRLLVKLLAEPEASPVQLELAVSSVAGGTLAAPQRQHE